MSKAGEEMVLELASLIGNNVVKTAAKDEKKDKPCKCDKKNCGCRCEGDAEKCKCKKEDKKVDKKPDKKALAMTNVLQSLVKLAGDLDDIGAREASSMVDDALKIIIKNLERKNAMYAEDEGPEDVSPEATESFEDEGDITGREEGMGSRTEHTLQEPNEGTYGDSGQPRQDETPEGLGMQDYNESSTAHEDKLDELFQNPEFRAKVKELLG